MARAIAGNRHQISIEVNPGGQISNVRAVCVCAKLAAPWRFGRLAAEEDGHQHLLDYVKNNPLKEGGM